MKKFALIALSFLLVVSVLAFAACGDSDSSTNSSLDSSSPVAVRQVVPQKANLVAGLSLSALGDRNTQESYDKSFELFDDLDLSGDMGLPESYDELLKMIQDKIGLDLKTLKEVVIFADIPAMTSYEEDEAIPCIGAVISGTFKQDEMVVAIEKTLGHNLGVETYNGNVIYSIQSYEPLDISDSDAVKLAFLGETALVIGSDPGVKDVVDVNKGDEQGLSGELLSLYEGLGDAQAKLVLEIQKDWLTDIPDQADLPGFGKVQVGAFRDMKMATLAITQSGNTGILDIKVDFYNSNSANSAKGIIDGLLNLVKGLVQMTSGQTDSSGMAAVGNILNSLKLSVSGTWLTLHLEVTTDQINELLPLFQSMLPAED